MNLDEIKNNNSVNKMPAAKNHEKPKTGISQTQLLIVMGLWYTVKSLK